MSAGKGCLGCAALVFGLPLVFGAITVAKLAWQDATAWRDARLERRAREREEEKVRRAEAAWEAETLRRQELAAAETARKSQEKTDALRAFALKEAPKLWEVHQTLESEIAVQNGKVEDLRKTLVAFGKQPEADEDFVRICALRDEIVRARDGLQAKLEDAYIAAKKYEASPDRGDYRQTMQRAIREGVQDAAAATERYRAMARQK